MLWETIYNGAVSGGVLLTDVSAGLVTGAPQAGLTLAALQALENDAQRLNNIAMDCRLLEPLTRKCLPMQL